jgi:hypothetical protein
VTLQTGENGRYAAHTIAALLDFRAIGIEHTVGGRILRVLALCNPHQLVETGTRVRIAELPDLSGRGHGRIAVALVDDENQVPGAVQFGVRNVHGHLAFAAVVYINPYRSNDNYFNDIGPGEVSCGTSWF